MSNTTKKGKANEAVVVAFQKFNGVFLAKISNLLGKETFAYGENRKSAQINALRNYRLKYSVTPNN